MPAVRLVLPVQKVLSMVSNRKQQFIYLVVLLTSFSLVFCQSKTTQLNTMNKTLKYEWIPSASAPKNFPVEIHRGRFIDAHEEYINIPAGHTLNEGWGVSGPTHIIGESLKNIPEKLEIVWLSYLEAKFYKGTFDLPSEKIHQLFKDGYINRLGKEETYGEINVGMAPGGLVSVWVVGNGWTTEIDTFKAVEANISIQEFAPSATMSLNAFIKSVLEEDFSDEEKAGMNADDIPFGLWNEYRKKYQWAVSVDLKSESELTEVYMSFVNGESIYTVPDNDILKTTEKSLPGSVKLEWKDDKDNLYGAKVFFDFEEIKEAFNILSKVSGEQDIKLSVVIDKYHNILSSTLQKEDRKIAIKKALVKVYEISN